MASKKSFEQAMQKLEKIIKNLEGGDLPLEKAITNFEEGISLSKYCSAILNETEQKISVLLKDVDGNVVEEPFVTKENDG